ncbi:hypothetical protein J6590_021370 [Homalodisca vitripennis]|nr:hypothetical protein J6590_021370 [Homalodisca vitripennis]
MNGEGRKSLIFQPSCGEGTEVMDRLKDGNQIIDASLKETDRRPPLSKALGFSCPAAFH